MAWLEVPAQEKTRNELVSKVNYLSNQINTEFKVEISKLSGGAVEAIKLLFSTMFCSYIQNEKCHLEQINYKKWGQSCKEAWAENLNKLKKKSWIAPYLPWKNAFSLELCIFPPPKYKAKNGHDLHLRCIWRWLSMGYKYHLEMSL